MNEILFVLNNDEDGVECDNKVHLVIREVDALWFNVAQCGVSVDQEGGYEQPLKPIIDFFGGNYPIPDEMLCQECFGLKRNK